MTFDQFIIKYLGKPIDFDGYYGGQCVDLFRQYVQDVLNNPQPKGLGAGGAKDFWTNYPTDPALKNYYDRIDNTPTGVPLKGDVVIWGKGAGGGFGHIAVFIEGNTKSFTSFDQNWPTLSKCTKTKHDYVNVLGWLHPKKVSEDSPTITILVTERDQLVSRSVVAKEVGEYLELDNPDTAPTEAYIKVIAGIKSTATSAQNEVLDLKTKLASAQAEVSNREEQVSRLKVQLTEQEKQYKDLSDALSGDSAKWQAMVQQLQGSLKAKQDEVNEASKAKGKALIDLAEAKAQLESCLAGGKKPSILDRLWSYLSGLLKPKA